MPIERKYAQFRRPLLERECICNFWNFWPMAKLVLKQNVKAHGPLVFLKLQSSAYYILCKSQLM